MRRFWIIIAAAVTLALASPAGAGWKAGAAKVVITPAQPMWMAGYGARSRPSDGLITELYAKALALQDDAGNRLLMLSLDVVGIDRDTSALICETLEKKHGLKREQIALCTSHTHSGPVMGRTLRSMYFLDEQQDRLVTEYTREFREKVVKAAGEAIAQMQEAEVSYASGRATFAVNRRNNKEPDVPELRAAGQLKGPVDHDVPVLKVTARSGELLAVVFGYACHATVLSGYQWCADYPGFAMAKIEEQNPNAVALFFAGCGADQNPLPRRTVELATQYGHELAAAVQAVLGSSMKPLPSKASPRYAEVALPLASLPSRADLEKDTQSPNKFIVSRAKMLLRQLDAGRELPPTYPYPVQVWTLGDELRWVLLGGEVVVDYSLRLKQELGPGRTWVAGYSNDVMAYIPSRRVLTEGGYEGATSMIYYGLPTTWGPAVEEVLIEAVHRLAK